MSEHFPEPLPGEQIGSMPPPRRQACSSGCVQPQSPHNGPCVTQQQVDAATAPEQTTVLRVTKRSSPRGSRGGTMLHVAGVDGRTPACGAATTSAASVVPVVYDTAREAYLYFVGSGSTCSRCYSRLSATAGK